MLIDGIGGGLSPLGNGNAAAAPPSRPAPGTQNTQSFGTRSSTAHPASWSGGPTQLPSGTRAVPAGESPAGTVRDEPILTAIPPRNDARERAFAAWQARRVDALMPGIERDPSGPALSLPATSAATVDTAKTALRPETSIADRYAEF
jgi:hypothetical protein